MLGLAPLLAAQSQPTFYAAYQDGLDAERQGQWQTAAAAFRRAIELRPASATRIVIYGNNLLNDYAPYTHLARCLIELGETEAAHAALDRAAHQREPNAAREALAHRLSQKAQAVPPPKDPDPVPAPSKPVAVPPAQSQPAPTPADPTPVPAPGPSREGGPAAATRNPPPPRRDPPPPRSPDQATSAPAQATLPTPAAAPQGTPAPASRLRWAVGLSLAVAGAWLLLRRRRRPPESSSFGDPEQLGPYRIERLLGRGGFASTYLARHGTTKLPVALKLLHPYRHDDPEFLRRFRQEAKLGAMLDHPNLVRMLDPGPEAGPPWLAMEYISGRRLDQALREDGPPSLPAFYRLALQIAGAMAHAHHLGIVHRDLKPGNVIFDGDQAKVMDFGISRIVDSNTLTTTYAFLGTPRYAAPEAQIRAQVGPAADRYSLGIMLFELLAGHPPFDGETPFEILDKHRRDPLPDLAALRPDLPAALVDLVERLCRKDPDQRPGDEEVLSVLTGLAG
ncbi:serine/threonine-protein kinase [Geothrix oryzisoli]|uniref:serine/threonine-protein kinase n=1 Tax=Geothrix oryzisoli TaxID=2922721 RepID=UPI0023DEE3CC|nr:serine/threonine-protein kinase [Geothrix oryzisoli]